MELAEAGSHLGKHLPLLGHLLGKGVAVGVEGIADLGDLCLGAVAAEKYPKDALFLHLASRWVANGIVDEGGLEVEVSSSGSEEEAFKRADFLLEEGTRNEPDSLGSLFNPSFKQGSSRALSKASFVALHGHLTRAAQLCLCPVEKGSSSLVEDNVHLVEFRVGSHELLVVAVELNQLQLELL